MEKTHVTHFLDILDTAKSKSFPPCWKKSADSSAPTPPPFWLLTPDFLDSHIPQGYQGEALPT